MKELRQKSQDRKSYNSQNRFTFSILVSERYVSNHYYYCFEKSALIWSFFFFLYQTVNSFCLNVWQKFICVYLQTYVHLISSPLGIPSHPLKAAALLSWCPSEQPLGALCAATPAAWQTSTKRIFLFPFVSARYSLPVGMLLEAS